MTHLYQNLWYYKQKCKVATPKIQASAIPAYTKKSRCTASLWRCTLMYNFNKKTIILLQNSQSLVCGGIGRVYLLYLFEISLSLGVIFLYDVVIAKV